LNHFKINLDDVQKDISDKPVSKFWAGFMNNNTLCYAKDNSLNTIKLNSHSADHLKTVYSLEGTESKFKMVKKIAVDILVAIYKLKNEVNHGLLAFNT